MAKLDILHESAHLMHQYVEVHVAAAVAHAQVVVVVGVATTVVSRGTCPVTALSRG